MKKKRCPRCGRVRDATCFYKDDTRGDHLSGYCRDCKRKDVQAHYNSDEAKARRKQFAEWLKAQLIANADKP